MLPMLVMISCVLQQLSSLIHVYSKLGSRNNICNTQMYQNTIQNRHTVDSPVCKNKNSIFFFLLSYVHSNMTEQIQYNSQKFCLFS